MENKKNKRIFVDATQIMRCQAKIVLKDKSTAQCGRRAVLGGLCAQHSKLSTQTVADMIAHLNPCRESQRWASRYTSKEKAWRECPRADWMVWLITLNIEDSAAHKKLVRCLADLARSVLPIYEAKYPKDGRVRECLRVVDRWVNGRLVSKAELTNAANSAYCAMNDVRMAANDPVYSSNDTYASAKAVAYAAYSAANDPVYSGEAANDSAYASTHTSTDGTNAPNVALAAIVRRHYPRPPGNGTCRES